MSPKTEPTLFYILTLIIYIASLFFVSYVFANCYIDFRKETICVTSTLSITAIICYSALHSMYYEIDCNFSNNTDKWGIMFTCVSVLMGIPMLCFILFSLRFGKIL